jgi:Big-like domain-containing protein
LAAVSSASLAVAPSYGDGAVTLTWTTGERATENLTVTPNPGVTGQKVTFTDTITPSISGSPAPTGAVTFQEYNVKTGASTNLATVPVTNGVATWTTSSLPAGTHSITPVYSGAAVYFPVYTGYTDVTIGQAGQAVALPRAGHALTPAVTGRPASRQSGSPPSSGRAENPLARSSRTASGANTQ